MLNADGVVNGNQRSCLSGLDFNRQWSNPSDQAPEIMATKEMIEQTLENRIIYMFADLHGHSRSKNIFMYGCNNNHSDQHILKERILPLILHKSCDAFSFDHCSFEVQSDKDGCARIALRQAYDILNSYTLECSYAGTMRGKYKGNHFTIQHLKRLGHEFARGLFVMTAEKKEVEGAIKELRDMYPSLNHLLNEDEGMYKEMASAEKVKLQELLDEGKIKQGANEIIRGKGSKMTNTRTVYEGERNMLKGSFFQRIFGCY